MKILMVEDSPFFGGIFRTQLEQLLNATIDLAVSMADAQTLLETSGSNYDAAILDYCLPDAPDGEIVPFIVAKSIPTIVFTASVDDNVRHFVWKHKVVDYVIKTNSSALDYMASLLTRLYNNRDVTMLVVDDSAFFRKVIADLLKVHQLNVLTAENGEEALAMVVENPAIKMVITDYNMPIMDGVDLTGQLRQKFSRDKLAIIGVSAEGDAVMAARFIKSGANDFIIKQSFLPEEFYCRVNQNLDALEHVFEIKEAAIRDHLTGLYNRRYFFDVGSRVLATAQQEQRPISCGMIDIDKFKTVNDTYGHHVGDIVLTKIATVMAEQLGELGILARLGGEEFCVLLADMDKETSHQFFVGLCETVAQTAIDIGGEHVPLNETVSIGVHAGIIGSLDEIIREADQNLYEAKETGRNRVVIS